MSLKKTTRRRPGAAAALRQAALLRLSAEIAAAHDEADVCRRVVTGLHDDALGYDFLGVFLVDDATGDRVLRASIGWPDAPPDWRLRPGQGLSERPLLDGRLHYTPEVTRDSRYAPALNRGSEVDLPLQIDGKTAGVLIVESSRPHAFGKEDFEILSAAANQASLAIGRARLLSAERRRADEQKALLDTMADLSAELELSKLLQAVLNRAVALLGVTGGELAIYDAARAELAIAASLNVAGKVTTGTRLKLGEGAMGLVAQTHQPLIIPEYREWTGRAAPYEAVEVHAVMVAPLLIGGRLVGAIAVMDENPARQFGEADLRLVNLFTPHAAIAIENASLYTSAQREKQYFEAVVLNSPVAIVTLDLDQNITACNPAFSKLFGYTAEDAVGRNLDELISTEAARSQAVDYTREAFHRVVHAFAQRRRKDGTLIDVEVSAVPVTVEGERVAIMALYHDVSELLRARQEAEAANRAKSQFLASMSHELRTPLNAIIGYSEMLVEEAGDQGHESFVLDLQKIRSAGKHLLALINDILDLSKIEAGKTELFIESFDPANLVREVATTVEPLVAKNANRLVMRLEPGLGTMRSDITKVRQVLLNLLSNACKFTEKGTLTLSAGRGGGERGDWITFAVEDTGVGMTAEQLGKVFEAFAQADPSITRKYGGTGLGLAITRRFCHMMGGEIDAAGEAGRGCKFTVRLPAKLSSAETPAAPLRAGGPGEGEVLDRDTILVIDDDPAALELMTRLLTGEGFAVVTAASGDLGLQLAKQLRPLAITLDVQMPGMDGWSVLATLKSTPELRDIPVIMVTILGDEHRGYAFGAADYLTKPIERGRLRGALARYRVAGRPSSVLVVEDDAAMRAMVSRVLEKDGWSVTSARNGREALSCLEAAAPGLILLDLMMPEMDGFEFVEELRKREAWRSIPVVVITAREISAEDRRRLHGSVERILQKGAFGPDALLREVRERVKSPLPSRPT